MPSDPESQSLPLILRALNFAAVRHRHQRRKDAEASPYINHPIAVANTLSSVGGVNDPVTLAAAILHDVIEDTDATIEDLDAQFGVDVRRIVEEVTDDGSLPSARRKQLQIDHAAGASEQARLVKLADKICNVRDMIESPPVEWPLERQREYLRWSHAVVERLRGTHAALEACFDRYYAQALEKLDGAT
jgi:guanosine-3',5'-bis(diphosphate) 3'-pyrophosphohydrolase